MTLRKLPTGNYKGYHMGHYFFIFKRPHGKWCCRIGKGGEWLYQEGYHGTFLHNLKKVKGWAKDKITRHCQLNRLIPTTHR
jgi:hypothetical protein